MPNYSLIKRELLEETHCWPYMVHPGSTKMFRDLQEINLLVEKHEKENSSICGKMFYLITIKVEHRRSLRLLQPLSILERK